MRLPTWWLLDIGGGSGRALNLLATTFPRRRFVGYDLSEEAIRTAATEAADRGLTNARFEPRDLTAFSIPGQYDLITAFDAIHDQAKPDSVLAAIAGALKPDGIFLMQDIAASSQVHKNRNHPVGPLLYTISCLHCMSVSLAQNGAGLGAMWGQEKAIEMLRTAGFPGVEIKRLPHDFQNSYFLVTRQPTGIRNKATSVAQASPWAPATRSLASGAILPDEGGMHCRQPACEGTIARVSCGLPPLRIA